MDVTLKNINEAADAVDEIGALLGMLHGRPYNRKGRVSAAREYVGLTPTQGRRAAYREWKQVPSQIMDLLREKRDELRIAYTETCESLEEKAREKIEENDAAFKNRRRQSSCMDGEETEREGEEDDAAQQVND